MIVPVADGLALLCGWPAYAINAFLVGDVLVDAGTRWARRWLLHDLTGRPPSAVALTHAHPDHAGSAAAVCRHFGVPLWCHALDAAAAEGREPMRPRVAALGQRLVGGPPHPVARLLAGGDDVAGFRVVPTPGHTPGHVSLFRERDRVLVVGDVFATWHPPTMWPAFGEPPGVFTVDPAENRRSLRALAELRPEVIVAGHGPPVRERAADRLERLARRLGE